MAVTVTTANAANSDEVKLWFDDFTPDAEVVISSEDSALCEKVMDYISKLIKRSVMKSVIENITPKVHEDYAVSKILNAHVFYIGLGTKKTVINYVNRACGLKLDPYALNIKLTIGDETLIFIESAYLGISDILTHCRQAQFNYYFKNYFLRGGKIRDPKKYADSLFSSDVMEQRLGVSSPVKAQVIV